MPSSQTTIQDFRKGITDNYLRGEPGQSKELYNFLLDENGNPYSREGFFVHDERIPVSSGNSRVSGIYLDSEPFGSPIVFRGNKAYNLNESDTWTEIVGPTSNVAIPNKTFSDQESAVLWQKQVIYASGPSTVLPHRIYCSVFSPTATFEALTLGLPALATTPTATKTAVSTNNYTYAFHHYYEFTDYDGTVYVEQGPVVTREVTLSAAPQTNQIDIAAIPVLANTSSTNYDTTAVKIKIFRTINNGSAFYYVGEVTNGTTTFTDNYADTTIDDNALIYTDGGAVEYTQPPVGSKFVTQVNDYFWYATSTIVTHSIQGAAGACPEEFNTAADQEIRGLSKILTFPILFCDRSIYRLEGVFDEFADGGFEFREISKDAGCLAHRSIVSIPGGLVWAGNGGFYFTDGYQVRKISVSLSPRYTTWRNSAICGTYDKLRNIVFWTISGATVTVSAPNNEIACLHLNFGITDDSSFTTIGSDNNIYPMSVAYSDSTAVSETFRSKLLVADALGYLYYMDTAAYTDPKVNVNAYPSAWTKRVIEYWWESVAMDFSDPSQRQYFTEILADFNGQTELSAQFFTRRDDGGGWGSFSEYKFDGPITWGITEVPWDSDDDDDDHSWNSIPIIDGRRHFPRGQLRSSRRQIALGNSFTYITRSDLLGTATVSATAKTVTLDNAAKKWPDDCEDYYLSFIGDSYATTFKIKERVSDTVVKVIDPYGTLTGGAAIEWHMQGYRKFERVYLISVTLIYDTGEQSFLPNRGTSGETNA